MNRLCRLVLLLAVAVLIPLTVSANNLNLPSGAQLLTNRASPLGSYAMPVGVFAAGTVPTRIFEGAVERQSWRLNGAALTTLQVLAPLREQISEAGYDILLDCRDQTCGGFDFRFATEVIPAPDMHVNIRDYRFLAAMRGDDEALSLLVSRTGRSIYIQLVHTNPQQGERLHVTTQAGGSEPQYQPNGLAGELQAQGHVALGDLVFETGSARLGDGPFRSLEKLAEFLGDNPGIRIALVGHTDSVGSLAGNILLSKRRAASVRARMTDRYAIAPSRIEAEGMGYLAPVASNLTPEGRKENRRVEAILLSTQ